MWKVLALIFVTLILKVTSENPSPFLDRRFAVNTLVDETVNPSDFRLPNDTRPIAYDISLFTRVDQNDFNFTGIVRIGIRVLNTTSIIKLHQKELTIDSVRLYITPTTLVEIHSVTYDNTTEFLTLQLEGFALSAGYNYTLEIYYSGVLRTDQGGFYASSYVNDDGETVYLATTQFEPSDARHGFPCYDEPSIKAHFTIRITHGEAYHAISNMPETRITNDDGTVTTSFEQTPLMSTYLVAYIVSDFTNISNYDRVPPEFPHRSFVRPNANHLTNLTLEAAIKILDSLNTYLGVNFSLPKMDQAGIPDFAFGAMENWGLVTYRENIFLFDDNVNTYTSKTSLVTVIGHEFAHQWFGNLVSPRWWTYIWLNEGFATLFEFISTDISYPDWNIMDYFVVSVLQNIFNTDATPTIRPMTYYVESGINVINLFDGIAYSKSGCVLRMFQYAFGISTFQKGLYYYLTARQFNDAAEEDLFEAMEQAVLEDGHLSEEYDVFQIMYSWTRQGGYPFIHVQRNYEQNTMRIAQERYITYPNGTILPNTYWIPYNFATASEPDFSNTIAEDWIPQNVRVKTIVSGEDRIWNSSDWIIFNKQQTGYYRVRYDRDNYKLISNELFYGDHERIHRICRSQLIDDAFTFARTNRLDWDIPFDIIKYLQYENEYIPFQSAVTHLNYLNRFINGIRNYQAYRDFLGNLFGVLFNSVGIEDIANEPHLRKYARTIAVNWACTYGYSDCRYQTNMRLRQWLTDDLAIHQNVQNVMYCAGLRSGNQEDYYDILFRIPSADTTIRNRYVTALGCISNTTILREYLNLSLNLTNQYFSTSAQRFAVFTAVYQNSHDGLEVAIQFLNENIQLAQPAYGSGNLGSAITGMAQRTSSEFLQSQINDLTELALSRNYISANTANTAYNYLFENVRWINSYARPIEMWLDDFLGLIETTTPGTSTLSTITS